MVGLCLVGAALVYFLDTLGFAVYFAFCGVFVVVVRRIAFRRLPERNRRQMLAIVDPEAGPPSGAQPVSSELLARYHDTVARFDWQEVQRLLADDFAFVDYSGRRHDARRYLRMLQLMARMYPDLRGTTEGVVAEPAHPGVLYFRARVIGHPRHGPDLDGTAWSRLTPSPDGTRLRELASIGVIRVA